MNKLLNVGDGVHVEISDIATIGPLGHAVDFINFQIEEGYVLNSGLLGRCKAVVTLKSGVVVLSSVNVDTLVARYRSLIQSES